MYFRRKTSAGRAYLQIVESRRDGDQVRQKVIATLGRFDELQASGQLERLVRSGARFAAKAMVLSAALTSSINVASSGSAREHPDSEATAHREPSSASVKGGLSNFLDYLTRHLVNRDDLGFFTSVRPTRLFDVRIILEKSLPARLRTQPASCSAMRRPGHPHRPLSHIFGPFDDCRPWRPSQR